LVVPARRTERCSPMTSGPIEYTDILIVGAGLSGVGAACQLRQECPDKSVVVLEGRGAIGGVANGMKTVVPYGWTRGASSAIDASTASSVTSLMRPPSSTVIAVSSRRPPSNMMMRCRDTGPMPAARNSPVSPKA
jgi:NADPH-dependent 2,4-dienoyl-CoA reductase/sulfur reductase-like enzyme